MTLREARGLLRTVSWVNQKADTLRDADYQALSQGAAALLFRPSLHLRPVCQGPKVT